MLDATPAREGAGAVRARRPPRTARGASTLCGTFPACHREARAGAVGRRQPKRREVQEGEGEGRGGAPADIGRRMAAGAAWMVALRLSMRALGLVSTLLLARLLAPADFGLVALATSIAAILEVAGDPGTDNALIARGGGDRKAYDTAWTLALLRGLFTAAVLVAAGPWLSAFFSEPRLEELMLWVALFALLEGAQNIGTVDFRLRLDFASEFHWQFWPKAASFVVALGFALVWPSYWALVAGILTRRLGLFLGSYLLSPYRPRPSLSRWRELFAVSRWILADNALVFLRDRIDSLVIGKLAGAHALGLYELANEVASLPTTEVAGPTARAVFPGYAKLRGDRAALRRGYRDSVGALLLVTLPLGTGIALVAEPAVALLLGPQWMEAVPAIRVLALYGILRSLYAPAGAAYLAVGRYRLHPALLAVSIAVAVPLLLWLVPLLGIVGAAVAMTATSGVMALLHLLAIRRVLGIGPSELLRPLLRPLAATAAMAGLLLLLPQAAHPALDLLLRVPAGALAFVTVLLLLWILAGRPAGPERHALTFLAGVRPLAPLLAAVGVR